MTRASEFLHICKDFDAFFHYSYKGGEGWLNMYL